MHSGHTNCDSLYGNFRGNSAYNNNATAIICLQLSIGEFQNLTFQLLQVALGEVDRDRHLDEVGQLILPDLKPSKNAIREICQRLEEKI